MQLIIWCGVNCIIVTGHALGQDLKIKQSVHAVFINIYANQSNKHGIKHKI